MSDTHAFARTSFLVHMFDRGTPMEQAKLLAFFSEGLTHDLEQAGADVSRARWHWNKAFGSLSDDGEFVPPYYWLTAIAPLEGQ